MKYEAWTWKAIEGRVLEMADTSRKVPGHYGPESFGSPAIDALPSQEEAYGYNAARYRESASAGELARMEQVWAWVNGYLNEAERKLIYAWSWVKVRKGLKISAFAAENDMSDRMLRREIVRLCQIIANNLNQIGYVRLNSEDCALSENEGESDQSDVTSKKCERSSPHWMDSDAKPIHDPDSPELAITIAMIQKNNERREKEARRRAKLQMEAA